MKKRREETPPQLFCKTQSELAEFLNVSASAVAAMRKEGLPREPDGTYEFFKCTRWREERLARRTRVSVPVQALRSIACRLLQMAGEAIDDEQLEAQDLDDLNTEKTGASTA